MSALWLITCVVAFHPIDFLTVLHPVSLAISLCDVIHRYRALICRCCPCVECVSCLHFSGCPLLSPAYVLVHMLCLCLCRVCGVKQQRSQSKKTPACSGRTVESSYGLGRGLFLWNEALCFWCCSFRRNHDSSADEPS